jgi:hypothetical protein
VDHRGGHKYVIKSEKIQLSLWKGNGSLNRKLWRQHSAIQYLFFLLLDELGSLACSSEIINNINSR